MRSKNSRNRPSVVGENSPTDFFQVYQWPQNTTGIPKEPKQPVEHLVRELMIKDLAC